jgi:hypothetical protein
VLELLDIVLAEGKEEWSVPVLSLATTRCRGHRSNKRSANGSCPLFKWISFIEINGTMLEN